MLIETPVEFSRQNGAEAIVDLIEWHDELVVRKKRIEKNYRNHELDLTLRSRRTKEEAVILHQAKLSGVNCPRVYFADPNECELVMEYIRGIHIKNILEDPRGKKSVATVFLQLGEAVARMHKANIAHGDLTTKNILVRDGVVFLIDFGLSFFSERVEDRAIDIHLLKQAIRSARTPYFASAFSHFMAGYEKVIGKRFSQIVSRQVDEIERRGRYARVD